MIKIAQEGKEETIEIYLSKDKTPIAYKEKVEELREQGMTLEEAEEFVNETPFVLEIYYEKSQGLFALESDFVGNCTEDVRSPYTGKKCVLSDLEDADMGQKEIIVSAVRNMGGDIDLCEHGAMVGENELRYVWLNQDNELCFESNNVHDYERGEDAYLFYRWHELTDWEKAEMRRIFSEISHTEE